MKNKIMLILAFSFACVLFAKDGKQVSAAALLENGSFETEGSRADGLNQKYNKGWAGTAIVPNALGGEAGKKARHQKKAMTRTILPAEDAPDGKHVLVLSSMQADGETDYAASQLINRISQVVVVPLAGDAERRYLLSFKFRGHSGANCLSLGIGYKASVKNRKSLARIPSFTKSFSPDADEWKSVRQEIVLRKDCDRLEVSFSLFGYGNVQLDDIRLEAVDTTQAK